MAESIDDLMTKLKDAKLVEEIAESAVEIAEPAVESKASKQDDAAQPKKRRKASGAPLRWFLKSGVVAVRENAERVRLNISMSYFPVLA